VKLAEADKKSMIAMLQALIQESQRGQRPALLNAPLQSKLCGILAIALCSSPDECRALLDNLIAQAPTADTTALAFFVTVARCVCEEMQEAELSFSAKDAMELHVASVSGDVVRVLSDVVLSPQSAVQGDALLCLRVWMKRAGTSLTRLYSSQPRLLAALIETLGQQSTHLSASAEILCQVFKVSEYPSASLQEEALQATARGLLSLQAAYESAVASEEEEIAHVITDAVATFCETYTDWIVEGEAPEAVALGEMMLRLGLHPKRQIASLTLEFWLLVQEEAVAERHIFFKQEAFVRLLSVLLQQSEYPATPDEMDEFDLDDLVAYRSGSQGVADVLMASFVLLKEQFLTQLLTQIASSQASWQVVEVCLFAASTVADDIKKRLLSSLLWSEPLEAMTQQLLESLFQVPPPQQHPLVTVIGSKLLGQFGSWFNEKALSSSSAEAVTTVLQYLDQAMIVDGCRPNAVKSFMQITTSCSRCLVDMPPAFLVSVVQHFSNHGLKIEDRLMVVEGLVRVAALSSHSSEILQRLLDDSLGRLDQVLSVENVGIDVLVQVVCDELQVCSKMVRFLDAPQEVAGGKALTKWVVETIWGHVEPVAGRLSANESAMNALFEFYGWCLQSLREEMGPQLPAIANLIVRIFKEELFVAPLECGSIAVDVFGRGADQNVAVLDSFRGLMGVLSQIAFQVFTARGVDEAPDVLRALFELAYRFLLYCPAAVITASEFSVLLDLCRACVGNQDRGSTNAMLTFIIYLLQESRGKLAPFQTIIDQSVWGDSSRLESWVDALLLSLATKTPSVLYESVSRLFMALWIPAFDQYGAAVATLTNQSLLTKAEMLGVQELTVEDRQHVAQLWFRYAQAPTRMAERKFRSLCADFAKICRKELAADSLLGYEEDAK
jgi:hypothetical protein